VKVQFGICVLGVLICFCAYGCMQEFIFKIDGFQYGWYLTFIQFSIYSLIAKGERHIMQENNRRCPMNDYYLIAFFMVITLGSSNSACAYLSYPTQVMFKSCKLIPVMLGGKIILQRSYMLLEYLSALLLVIGLCTLTMADMSASHDTSRDVTQLFNPTGLVLILISLGGDAFISNLQEKSMKTYDISQTEMVYYCHLIGSSYLFVFLLVNGQLFSAFSFCWNKPYVYICMILFSIFGYLGIQFVLVMIKLFDAFVAMTVTTCRKIITIALSFLFFPKPFTFQYFVAAVFVFGGMYVHIYSKHVAQGKYGVHRSSFKELYEIKEV